VKRFVLAWILGVACLALSGCDQGEYLINRGNHAFYQGKLTEAENDYQQAANYPKTQAAALYNSSRVAAALGNEDRSLDYLNRSLAVEPLDPQALLDRGDLLTGRGQAALAESDFLAAIKAQPSLGEAWLGLARVKAAQGLGQEALASLARAAADSDTRGEALLLRGRWLRQNNDPKAALQDLESASQTLPYSAELSFEQARAYRALNDPREAIRRFRQGLNLDPGNPQAQKELAETLAEIGEAAAPAKATSR
jgi:tetratricopeptide (TPR) repeat protein